MDFFLSLSLDLLVVNTFCDDMIFYYIFSFDKISLLKLKLESTEDDFPNMKLLDFLHRLWLDHWDLGCYNNRYFFIAVWML